MAWVTDEVPDRGLGGGHIRQAHLVAGLSDVADVTLVVSGDGTEPALREQVVTLLEVPDAPPRRWRIRSLRRVYDLWFALGGRAPREVAITAARRRRLRPVVRRLDGEVDVVVVSHLSMAALLPARPRSSWIVDLHHISSTQAEQEQALQSARRKAWLLGRQAAKARRLERQILERATAVTVVSEDDAVDVTGSASDGRRVVVVPNGVDARAFRPTPLGAAPRIVMTASFQYGPNVDGAAWFCTEVLPLVRAQVPEVTLDLVGRDPLPEVVALAERPGIALHADVPSVVPWLDAARVAIVPLRFGSGTRLKALEAMASGRPVVGTTPGLVGLGAVDGEQVLVADDAAAFAAAVVRVLRDDDLAHRLARAGRELVEERFDWAQVVGRLRDLVLRLS